MEFRSRVIPVALVLALAIGALLLLWRNGQPAGPSSLLAHLPAAEGPVLFIDFAVLRRTGLLEQLAGPETAEDTEFQKFVSGTGFHYRQDLDRAVVALLPDANYFVLEGRFDFAQLARYTVANGGRCVDRLCSLTGSSSERLISFLPLNTGRLGLAVSPTNSNAAMVLTMPQPAIRPEGDAPVWMYLPSSAIHPRLGLPAPVNGSLAALEGALWLRLSVRQSNAISLEAQFPSPASAAQAAARLPGGSFHAKEDRVLGSWPIPSNWLNSFR